MDLPKNRPGKARLVGLPPTKESLGAVLHFLSVDKTFGSKPLAGVVSEIRLQLKNKWHLCAIRDNRLVGYCGWVFTTTEIAEKYIKGEPPPRTNVPSEPADTPVLTIVCIPERQLVLPMVRAMRKLGQGKRVFFRREYFNPTKPKRVNSVINVPSAENEPPAARAPTLTITITPS
jgi:hypothetical protein